MPWPSVQYFQSFDFIILMISWIIYLSESRVKASCQINDERVICNQHWRLSGVGIFTQQTIRGSVAGRGEQPHVGRQVQTHSAQTDHRANGREEQRQEASSLAHQLAQESGRWNQATRWVEMFGEKGWEEAGY